MKHSDESTGSYGDKLTYETSLVLVKVINFSKYFTVGAIPGLTSVAICLRPNNHKNM